MRAPPEVLEMRLELEELWLDHNRLETIPSVCVALVDVKEGVVVGDVGWCECFSGSENL